METSKGRTTTNFIIGNTMNELEMRQLYVDLQPGDRVEVVHHVKIGFKEHAAHTVGVVVQKERRRSGMDSGFARHWDDKCWFDHLTLRKDDGELTAVTMDEYTELRRLAEPQRK
jgi:hypothetical protein